MKSTYLLTAFLLFGGPAAAGASTPPSQSPGQMAGATMAAETASRAEPRLERAARYYQEGLVEEARAEYAAVARRLRDEGRYAGQALWGQANTEFATGRHTRATATLMTLAREAEVYGDPDMQARALLEAAVLYERSHNPQRALASVERLKPLLDSPCLSESTRHEITTRVQGLRA